MGQEKNKTTVKKKKDRTMTDLLVTIPSKSRPKNLVSTLNLLMSTCSDKNNFDIQIILDADQAAMYQPVIKKFNKDIIWSFIEPGPQAWQRIYLSQHKVLREANYYFAWKVTDDIYGLKPGWDEAILKTKKSFGDDIFLLYTKTMVWGRYPYIHELCYTWDPFPEKINKNFPYAESVLKYHEPLPIWTKKLGSYIFDFFEPPHDHVFGRELFLPCIIKILKEKYDITRNVPCDVDYEGAVNDQHDVNMYGRWYEMQQNGFPELNEVADRIAEDINNFQSQKTFAARKPVNEVQLL